MPRSKKPLHEQAGDLIAKLLARRVMLQKDLAQVDAELAQVDAELAALQSRLQVARGHAPPVIVRPIVPEPEVEEAGPEADLDEQDDMGPGRWIA